MKDILIHHGVKGMKWGVRKQYEGTGGGGGGGWGPNTIATGGGPSPLAASMAGNPKKKKSVGKNAVEKMGIDTAASPEMAKRLMTRDTDARRETNQLNEKRREEISKVNKPDNWFGPDGKLNEEGRRAYDAISAIHDRYDKKERELWDKERSEIRDMQKQVFLNKEVEPLVRSAKETSDKLDSLYSENLGPNSSAYKEAFAKYKEAHKDLDDVEYGFDHYEWRKGNKDYDAAYKSMQKESKQLQKDYENQVSSIGKKILDTNYDQYKDVAMIEVDQFISFRYDEFKK